MQFQSLEFLFLFFPLFLILYYLLPARWRDALLAAGSLLFYCLNCGGRLWWAAIVAGLTALTWWAGKRIPRRKGLLGLLLGGMAGLLVFFKLFRGGALLPVGLSFIVFQLAAYLMDCFHSRLEPEGSLLTFSGKSMMFPKLLCGPLVQPRELAEQSTAGEVPGSQVHRGMEELILGLGMKVLVADPLGALWAKAKVVGFESISTAFAWIALIAFALQLYLDFFGYSLMAMGMARMLDIQLPPNFDSPYAARSVSAFYRRWHMTLGTWFREYVYFPLGGSRKGQGRTVLNLLAVWLLTGFWHGTGGNYLVWAGFLVFWIINEKLWLGRILERRRVLSHVYVIGVILLSWVPFAIGGWGEMGIFLGKLFGLGGAGLKGGDYLEWTRGCWGCLAAGVLLATPFPERLWQRVRGSRALDCALTALFWVVVYHIATAEQNPFLYYQF